MILCEALIDAMTFWCAGYRNVTAAYGVEGLTEDHLAAFARHGVRRVLIAFDRDEAGERGAAKVAERLESGRDRMLSDRVPEGARCQRLRAQGDAGRQILGRADPYSGLAG
ncbi:MAG: toprim domain-containing protein [Aliidongia sp.]